MIKESDLFLESLIKAKPDINKLTAKEIMTGNPVTVKSNESIKDIFNLLNDRGFSAIPVVNDKENLIGVLSQTDIVRFVSNKLYDVSRLLHSYQGADLDLPLRDVINQLHEARDINQTTIKEIMTRFIFSVNINTPVIEIVREMSNKKIHRVYVVDNSGILIGVISTLDIMKALIS